MGAPGRFGIAALCYDGARGDARMVRDLAGEVAKLATMPGIVFAEGPAGRRARVAGSGIEVFEIIATYRSVESDWELLRRSYEWLSEDQLRAALDFYAAYPEQIDEWLRTLDPEALEAFWRQHPSSKPPWR
jgi:uncharacterized protein (DUF433 family)